jgi:hypothetical protein
MNIQEDIYMQRLARILIVTLLLAAFLPCAALAFGGPTAIIVDDETGEPIEGAIALAQWIKTKFNFEGGFTYVSKARETVSDKEGKIHITGYWMWIPFTGKPTLTVYKPGYALWNSEEEAVPRPVYKPKDFSSSNNVVRLVKFEKAAAEWRELAHTEFQGKYPHILHSYFLSKCFETDLDTDAITLDDVFDRYEMPFRRQEYEQRRSEYEKSK